jgi:hypothetical protein
MNSETLAMKLDMLLPPSSGNDEEDVEDGRLAFELERFLVAWVLLGRLPEDRLQRAWRKHRKGLAGFARELLLGFRTTTTAADDDELLALYLRLVAQVVARLEDFPVELGEVLMITWQDITCTTHSRSVALNVDIYNALLSWLEGGCSTSDEALILNYVWEAYASVPQRTERGLLASRSVHSEFGQGGSSGVGSNTSSKQKMKEILNSLLSDGGAMDRERTEENWRRIALCTFELYGQAASEELVRKILFWVSIPEHLQEDRQPQEMQFDWHEWLMTYVGQHISSCADSNLLLEPTSMAIMQNILLAHVVDPGDGALRAMAWQTMNAVVCAYGWDRCSKLSTTESSICVWTRLASGEWRIQLEETHACSATTRPILDGCGRLVMSVVQYLVQFDERPDRLIPMDSDALLHLRKSLEEMLYITSEYLKSSNSDSDINPVASQLWSCLFSEIDMSTLITPEPVIACLQRRLSKYEDDLVLLDVASLLNAAQGDQRAHDIALRLQGSIVSYLDNFWQTLSNPEQMTRWAQDEVSWACTCMEILDTQSPEVIRNLTIKMTQAMQILLDYLEVWQDAAPQDKLLSNLRIAAESCQSIVNNASIKLTIHESQIVSHALSMCMSTRKVE